MLRADAYKDTTTSRGYKYHYYFAPARDLKPTLLFCHGFPSTSQDWHRIVPYFEQQGYGIVAPDMLGYGGTDKPTDPAAYKGTLLAKDIVDVFTAENIDKVIAVGHDWYVICCILRSVLMKADATNSGELWSFHVSPVSHPSAYTHTRSWQCPMSLLTLNSIWRKLWHWQRV